MFFTGYGSPYAGGASCVAGLWLLILRFIYFAVLAEKFSAITLRSLSVDKKKILSKIIGLASRELYLNMASWKKRPVKINDYGEQVLGIVRRSQPGARGGPP